jgi:rRNA processing protein Gar1
MARSGRLIVKAQTQVRDGSLIVDEKGRRTGKVMETIGSVASPFLSVQPLTDRVERIIGTKLYIQDRPADRSGNNMERGSRDQYKRNKRKFHAGVRSNFSNKRARG